MSIDIGSAKANIWYFICNQSFVTSSEIYLVQHEAVVASRLLAKAASSVVYRLLEASFDSLLRQ